MVFSCWKDFWSFMMILNSVMSVISDVVGVEFVEKEMWMKLVEL